MNKNKLRVAVVFGGRSGEHEISVISARSIMGALDRDKYEIIPVGITRNGQWIIGGDPMKLLDLPAIEDPKIILSLRILENNP